MKEFNGYRSWNSWNVALWINNTESLYLDAVSCVNTAKERVAKVKRKMEPEEAKRWVCKYAMSVFMRDVPTGERTPDGAVYTKIAVRTVMEEIFEGGY